MTTQRKILVPLGPADQDLKGVHHALALAERLQARVFVLRQAGSTRGESFETDVLEKPLGDLINSARQAGLDVSHHIVHGMTSEELLTLIQGEGIDLLVLGEDGDYWASRLSQVRSRILGQIIQVKGKNHLTYV